jgi:hypothetical protein
MVCREEGEGRTKDGGGGEAGGGEEGGRKKEKEEGREKREEEGREEGRGRREEERGKREEGGEREGKKSSKPLLGTGKTSSLAKICYWLRLNNFKVFPLLSPTSLPSSPPSFFLFLFPAPPSSLPSCLPSSLLLPSLPLLSLILPPFPNIFRSLLPRATISSPQQ